MKKQFIILAAAIIGLGLLPAYSQPGMQGGPQFGGAMGKLFGDNQAFSATMEMQASDQAGNPVTIPGKLAFDTGKSRFEINMADIKGGHMPPNAAAQMKAMGMDQMVAITHPELKIAWLIYPGLKSYAEIQVPDSDSPTNSTFKMTATEIGKETVDGHPCVENKVVVVGKDGVKHESTVWNATDLKTFPVKIQTVEQGETVTMLFKNVSLTKPAASQFDAPSSYKKYDSMQAMQMEMMKRMAGGAGMPPSQP